MFVRLSFACFFWFVSSLAFGDPATPPAPAAPPAMTPEQVAALVDENKRMKELIEKNSKKDPDPKPDPGADPLLEKVEKEKREKSAKAAESRQLETALKFNMSSDTFIKDNQNVLPKEIAEVFATANKENYDSEIEKANATKSAIVKTFFSQQANLDLLTGSQKATVEDFLKLSNIARQEKAAEIFVNVFEPTVENMKRVKKAEQVALANNGRFEGDDSEKAFIDKMVKGSNAHYLGVKHGT